MYQTLTLIRYTLGAHFTDVRNYGMYQRRMYRSGFCLHRFGIGQRSVDRPRQSLSRKIAKIACLNDPLPIFRTRISV